MSEEPKTLLKGVAASGATVPPELKTSYEKAKKSAFGSSQFIKIQMRDNTFQEILNTTGGLDRIQRECQEDEPAYFIWFRSKNDVAVLLWVPDGATTKDKTMYSTSKGAINDMVTSPGTHVEHIFGSKKSDFSQSSMQSAKEINESTMTYVEKELRDLPRELPKSDLKKSQGYGLIAQIKGIPMPDKLKNYSNTTSNNNTFPRAHKSHVPKGDTTSRNIASAAAHAINTTSSPSEAAHVASLTPKASPKSSPTSATSPTSSSNSSTFGSQSFETCATKGCNGRRTAQSDYCVVHSEIHKAKGTDHPETPDIAGKKCAVDGCDAERFSRGYCASHSPANKFGSVG